MGTEPLTIKVIAMTKTKIFLAGLSAAMLFTAFGIVNLAHANPLQFKPTVQTATATTTVSYMTAGTATTTLTLDSYAPGQPFTTDQAVLFIQFTASTSASILNTTVQYSQDGIDWYSDGGTFENGFATTTKPYDLSQIAQYTLSNGTTTRAINITTPTRFIRAQFSIPVGSAASGVWAQWIPSRQSSQ